MAHESGENVVLKVSDGGSPSSFTTIAGQLSGTFSGSENAIDVTDKDSAKWRNTIGGIRSGSVQCNGVADVPDANGLDMVRDAFRQGNQIECQLHVNAAGDHWLGFFRIASFDEDGDHNDAIKYSMTLESAAALSFVTA